MEAALLMLDALAIAVLVYTSLKNDRLPPGAPTVGPFRYKALKDMPTGSREAGSGWRKDATSRNASRRK